MTAARAGRADGAGGIQAAYLARTPASAAAGQRAERVMPAGETRASGYHAPYPLTLLRGEGARVWDVDGNEYWDLLGNFSALVHGHAYPPIVAAAEQALERGSAWPARNLSQIELAELLCERVVSVEQVRFTNSGTEAGLLALAAARVATGRPKVLMARHGYHGSHEAFEFGTHGGHSAAPDLGTTLLAEYGDAASFEAALAEIGDEIAAVFLEGVMFSGGIVGAAGEFYHRVLEAAHRAGALFVLDEVVTFRLAPGGVQELYGIRPDLTMFGKIIGGGFPVGAVGGSAEAMSVLDPRRGKFSHSGTFNGNPVTTAAGVVSVRELTPERIEALDRLGARLEEGLRRAARETGLPFSSRRAGSLLNVYFQDEPPAANQTRADLRQIQLFHLAGLNRGLYFAPRGLLVLSTVMDEAAVDEMVDRAAAAMGDLAAEPALSA